MKNKENALDVMHRSSREVGNKTQYFNYFWYFSILCKLNQLDIKNLGGASLMGNSHKHDLALVSLQSNTLPDSSHRFHRIHLISLVFCVWSSDNIAQISLHFEFQLHNLSTQPIENKGDMIFADRQSISSKFRVFGGRVQTV